MDLVGLLFLLLLWKENRSASIGILEYCQELLYLIAMLAMDWDFARLHFFSWFPRMRMVLYCILSIKKEQYLWKIMNIFSFQANSIKYWNHALYLLLAPCYSQVWDNTEHCHCETSYTDRIFVGLGHPDVVNAQSSVIWFRVKVVWSNTKSSAMAYMNYLLLDLVS